MIYKKTIRRPLRVESLESRRLLAVLTVTSASDDLADDGQLTLREAIMAANSNQVVDGVSGETGKDIIEFAPELSEVPLLLNGRLEITESLTIRGNGSFNTILRSNNNGLLGILHLSDQNGAEEYVIEGISLEGSEVRTPQNDGFGGAIYFDSSNQSKILIRDSWIHDNQANTGGGVFIKGAIVHVDSSTVSNNLSDFGGGFSLQAVQAVMTNTTIVGNEATVVSGGIDHFASYDIETGSTLDLINVTMAHNMAPAGTNIRNGATDYDATVRVANSVIYSAANGKDLQDDVFGTGLALSSSLGHNVFHYRAQLQKRVDDQHFGIEDIGLVELNNQGGKTPIRELFQTSKAIDAGDNTLAIGPGPDMLLGTEDDVSLIYDQRGEGFSRIVDGGSGTLTIDSGASEQQRTFDTQQPLVVRNSIDELYRQHPVDPNDLSLREAIDIANIRQGADVITFAPELSGETIKLVNAPLDVTDSLRVNGLGAENLTLDSDFKHRIFVFQDGIFGVESGILFELQDMKLINGDAPSGGGAIFALLNQMIIRNVDFRGNKSPNFGGAVFANQTDTTIINSNVDSNTAPRGGGIAFLNASGALQNVNFTNNYATGVGGGGFAAWVTKPAAISVVSITDSTFSGNVAPTGFDIHIATTVPPNEVELHLNHSIFLSQNKAWQHPTEATDVNADNMVSALDALMIVNELRQRVYSTSDIGTLQSLLQTTDFPNLYYDVSGDGRVSALDALEVINEIRRRRGESEQVIFDPKSVVDRVIANSASYWRSTDAPESQERDPDTQSVFDSSSLFAIESVPQSIGDKAQRFRHPDAEAPAEEVDTAQSLETSLMLLDAALVQLVED
ncbi:dockerin type I domain-containing protein [Stieleria varia]|uniref:Dockerin type I repeat protein n=1 Tax=Stieleria varia TaxID=2528005 RepID=A0A5C6BBM4_9BACT|nr:dockerin type I domain-containing protein [Stieleria varia]TWU07924.1 Dockerin type I repeat protein [Stieleria varia]